MGKPLMSDDERRQKNAARQRAFLERNRQRVNEKKVAALNANPDLRKRAAQIAKAWAEANPDRVRDTRMRAFAARKARRLGIDGDLSVGLFSRLLVAQRGLCHACSADLTVVGSHLDHVVPFAKGGPNTDENVRLLCPTCNTVKGSLDEAEFQRLLASRCGSKAAGHG